MSRQGVGGFSESLESQWQCGSLFAIVWFDCSQRFCPHHHRLCCQRILILKTIKMVSLSSRDQNDDGVYDTPIAVLCREMLFCDGYPD